MLGLRQRDSRCKIWAKDTQGATGEEARDAIRQRVKDGSASGGEHVV